MDVGLFLALPIDIRRQVYYHLDGNFSCVTPAPIEQLYSNQFIELASHAEECTSRQRYLKRRFYEVFSPYLSIFDYSPSLIGKWLEYSLWLRYDSIVLDCMRLNHAYGGSLIGRVDWIYLDGRLRLAYFKNCMLVVWYMPREYARWIVREESEEEELESIDFFRLNLEYCNPESLKKIFKSMHNNDLFLLVSEVFLEQEEETGSPAAVNADVDEITYPIEDLKVIELLAHMESMKNLNKVSVRGDHLFEALINFHGYRDNPGKTINYMVKRRIMRLELCQLTDPAKSRLADLTRWENLRELRLVNLDVIDLNKLVLPALCKILILERISELIWWDLESKLSSLIDGCTINQRLNETTQLKLLNGKTIDPNNLGPCQSIVWQAFKHLNFLKLQNVTTVRGARIVIPNALFYGRRVLIFPTTRSVKEIVII